MGDNFTKEDNIALSYLKESSKKEIWWDKLNGVMKIVVVFIYALLYEDLYFYPVGKFVLPFITSDESAYIFIIFIFGPLFVLPFFILRLLRKDFKKINYVNNYRNSIFYTSSGLKPSEIVGDKGLEGEFWGLYYIQGLYEDSTPEAEIFYSVVIPKKRA